MHAQAVGSQLLLLLLKWNGPRDGAELHPAVAAHHAAVACWASVQANMAAAATATTAGGSVTPTPDIVGLHPLGSDVTSPASSKLSAALVFCRICQQ